MSKQSPLPARRRGLIAIGAVGACIVALVTAGAAHANTTTPLPGSTFEGGDGNMIVDNPGDTDWANAAGVNFKDDLQSGSGDNAFGQGTKEDATNPTVVFGSIPPNKNDLTRFYEASEQVSGGDIFLYLAWERAVNIGSANLDFEINQAKQTLTDKSSGPVTLNRTAGDLLVSYDFSGSGTPTISLSTWITTGSASSCNASSTLPCWGGAHNVPAADYQAAVNTVAISDPIKGVNLGAGLFGEAAINLTGAGVFKPGVCQAFGSAFIKSRSSTSFTAELKDFIAPTPVNITNCGSITVKKVTQNAPANDVTPFPFTTSNLTPASFSLMGGGQTVYNKLGAGTYGVTEGTEPTGWNPTGVACADNATNATVGSISGETATITLGAGQNVTCTYTNHFTNSPTITTMLPGADANGAATVDVGSSVSDTATLHGATTTPSGTVSYTVYSDAQCQNPLPGVDAGTKLPLNNGTVPASNSVAFNTVGKFYWVVSYSGDADNNAATSTCGSEVLTVAPKQPTASTAQNLVPNDSFTLAGGFNPTGTITFNLYGPGDLTCSKAPVIGPLTVTVNQGNNTYTTSNTASVSAQGTYRWMSTYSGDGTNNLPVTSACGVEQFTINDNYPTPVP
ncbi:hypothetical protein [Microbacterium candidum]|uniref:Uncharacterized protein n=1 Tax=Microbacterium candidum TaxID=3041922 RepID=A0ABT7MYB2_9MICO|nr:hypothetical protein [Microbacterium sp. ASV49]MDL9979433.1 hypothetical protein [Microbacterium sp. ASV49]